MQCYASGVAITLYLKLKSKLKPNTLYSWVFVCLLVFCFSTTDRHDAHTCNSHLYGHIYAFMVCLHSISLKVRCAHDHHQNKVIFYHDIADIDTATSSYITKRIFLNWLLCSHSSESICDMKQEKKERKKLQTNWIRNYYILLESIVHIVHRSIYVYVVDTLWSVMGCHKLTMSFMHQYSTRNNGHQQQRQQQLQKIALKSNKWRHTIQSERKSRCKNGLT